ncbi:phenylacetic acid degradation protein PaaN [Marinitenerispora sediminis]|uniref:Phenylacetic acid degradation protein PaaN n=1 Tax=Marinitenerispora sediminis TaxID=1931232 RepID=A0A368T998_9ACTN|nr:phenylacetic acid degradation protein PaaN [Marinitenerispora sediminis]RCV54756.1 phenylacetic acid degradation protein PaaN [Marinitenerispora sediminis]RCV60568.1 phenylacetic acid degradation protein PaaN [Marinitenerispora sediminis]RCV61034.1 phenylacetic acid degradation protein PaaN [Marinitenerispora sediminis]
MSQGSTNPSEFFARHRDTLKEAVAAVHGRYHWSPYPESPSPKVYGPEAGPEGQAAFERYLGADFPLDQPGGGDRVVTERSPYGIALGTGYPHADVDTLLSAATAALPRWRDAGAEVRAGVCLEILHRLNRRSFEIAHAVQHTSGQAFVMAFQAGGPQAQDRGLEAVAYGYDLIARYAGAVRWEKPQRKGDPLVLQKRFHAVPRGVALVIGCNTFPTWNSYPGLFASLVTGNPVIVKPHPRAVLPLAITVAVAREVLAEAGYDPDTVLLAAEQPDERLAATLAVRPEVRIIDYTGSTEFGDWLERNAPQAFVNTEKAGVNPVVIDSTDDYAGMLGNLAFSLSLYSGQMCTTPQNIFVPRAGITTDEGHRSVEQVGADLAAAVDRLLGDTARATGVLGAIANDAVLARLEEAGGLGEVLLASRSVAHPDFAGATVRTPAIIRVGADRRDVYGREHFGPIAFLVPAADTGDALRLLRETVSERGALTAAVYTREADVLTAAERAALDAGVHLSANLTGQVFVNQSAAFSDYHGTGANPAATAALTDPRFVAGRFTFVQSRRPA